ncbi:MAG: protein kinase [Thermoanaerobaculia bacterium]|nr:protein kinase [Thermoanaerobaculia bacterium]
MIGRTLSHYRILEKLGEGGMGAVYAAEDSSLGRKVALKILPQEMAEDPDRLKRFEREAKTVAALNHPNIVTIHSVEVSDGTRFLTMELVDGESLETLIPSGGMALERFFALAVPLADALDAAHARGITHRDLKPANVMLTAEGRVKVLDFGLAKLAQGADDGEETQIRTQTLTQEGTILGTVPYMSPEQVQALPTDHRTDIFSLGVMLYEMATGRRPFSGDTQAALISSILKDVPQPANEVKAELPNHLGRVIRRCLEKDPGRRYQTARDLKNELEELEREAGTEEEEAVPSMAVLPFADFSPEKDQDYFCEGIAEEIISLLVKVEGLRVVSRTSAFQIKDSSTDIREIGQKLGVDSVLGGSVRKAGNRLRITAQLIDVEQGHHVWAERYDRTLEDVFAIQDEIAAAIVDALQVELSPRAKADLQKQQPETDVQAYDYYLRGRKAFWEFRKEGFEQARQMFARALLIDPGYARAYAGAADCCSFLYMYFESTEDNLREAMAASRRAVEINPESASAHASRGLAVSLGRDYEEASREFETAIRLDPKLYEAYYFYARALLGEGKLEQAAEYFAKASEVNPDDFQALAFVGLMYAGLGREDDAKAAFERTVEKIDKHLELHPNDSRALDLGAAAHARLGNDKKAEIWASKATVIDPNNPAVLYNVACTYALLGKVEEGVDCLEQSIDSGMAQVEWIEHDPDLDPLRDNDRFQDLLTRVKARHAG